MPGYSFGRQQLKSAVVALVFVLSSIHCVEKASQRVSANDLSAIFVIEHPGLGSSLLKLESLVSTSIAQERQPVRQVDDSWEPIDGWIASTPQRRLHAAKELGIAKGEWVVIFLSTDCDACRKIALEINSRSQIDRIVAVTTDPLEKATEWRKSFELKYRVESVPESLFEDLGNVVILPTVVKFRNGAAIAASGNAGVIDRCG